MIRLKNAHRGERALVVFGGPSLLAQQVDFLGLRRHGVVTFLETKALTPALIRTGFAPDYYLLLFPEKAKDNTLQHWIYRSFLARYRIDGYLRPQHGDLVRDMRQHFDEYFERWRPNRGPHKTYRWRPDVYLPDSPYDLARRIPNARIIVNRTLVSQYFPSFMYGDRAFYFDHEEGEPSFDMDKYYRPVERDGMIHLRCADTFLNSAAIALYPILHYMGFKETYFAGMDMSMLGSLEYSAPYTFRSMVHFWWFLRRNSRVFNANYKPNGWLFVRPQSEFDDLRMLWKQSPVAFTRIYDPWRYASPIDGIRTISMQQFVNQ